MDYKYLFLEQQRITQEYRDLCEIYLKKIEAKDEFIISLMEDKARLQNERK